MKTITRDQSAGARAVSVQCLRCGIMLRLCDAYIDKDGPAFQAYYHPDCWAHMVNEENEP